MFSVENVFIKIVCYFTDNLTKKKKKRLKMQSSNFKIEFVVIQNLCYENRVFHTAGKNVFFL